MRRLRLAAPTQLALDIPGLVISPAERWWSLSEEAQEAVVCVLARMIAAGVVDEDGEEVAPDDAYL
ncbi:MAG TPA: hypothetical protein VL984_15825 [Acidimicrobiales bacterium]|nr:hypothetical protein [Acidimicrobiales bacterium]